MNSAQEGTRAHAERSSPSPLDQSETPWKHHVGYSRVLLVLLLLSASLTSHTRNQKAWAHVSLDRSSHSSATTCITLPRWTAQPPNMYKKQLTAPEWKANRLAELRLADLRPLLLALHSRTHCWMWIEKRCHFRPPGPHHLLRRAQPEGICDAIRDSTSTPERASPKASLGVVASCPSS